MEWLNTLCSKLTAFKSFDELTKAMDGGYVPSIYPDGKRRIRLIGIIRSKCYRVFPYN